MALLRSGLQGVAKAAALAGLQNGARAAVCGLVIVRQRPGSARGVVFLTLEDESGVANVVVWPQLYERFRRAIMTGRLLEVTGRVQREDIVVHVVAQRIEDRSRLLDGLDHQAELAPAYARADLPSAQRSRPAGHGGSFGFTQAGEPSHAKSDEAKGRSRPRRIAPPAAPRHPREQAKALFPSRDFH